MKQYLPVQFILIVCFCGSLQAQAPTITASVFDNLIGTTFTGYSDQHMPQGNAGENQVWDFSSLSFEGIGQLEIVEPSTTPFADNYPTASIAIKNNSGGSESYAYYNHDAIGFYLLGGETEGYLSQTYSNPRKYITIPMTYGTNFEDSCSFTLDTFFGNPEESVCNLEVEVDGYGTLTTPSGTFNNVLRLHTFETTVTTIDDGIGEPVTITRTVDSYAWLVEDFPLPILALYEHSTNGQFQGSYSQYISGLTLSLEENATLYGVSIFPNPAADNITFDLGANPTKDLKISIIDLRGAVIKRISGNDIEDRKMLIDISELNAGVYFVNIQTAEGSTIQKLIKQ